MTDQETKGMIDGLKTLGKYKNKTIKIKKTTTITKTAIHKDWYYNSALDVV